MSWIDLNRSLGPPTGRVKYRDITEKNYVIQWKITEFSARHGYLKRMVSPRYQCLGIEFNLIMYSSVQKREKNGNFSLTIWGKSIKGVIAYSERVLVKYRLTVVDPNGMAKDVKEGKEQFFGYHVSLAHHHYQFKDISLVTSEKDEFTVYLEMEFNQASDVW